MRGAGKTGFDADMRLKMMRADAQMATASRPLSVQRWGA